MTVPFRGGDLAISPAPPPGGKPTARRHGRSARLLALAGGLTLALVLLSACNRSAPAATAIQKACHQVSAVLSNGPDPDTDPAGHAAAQILPLRQIHAPVKALQTAISRLDAAYQKLFASNGRSGAAAQAVAAASQDINHICPGAAT
jgi:hypothetical protein